jgi:GT2 family glycosyltransferase
MTKRKVLIHIVTWNSEDTIVRCVEHASAQQGFTLGEDLIIRVTDNASSDTTVDRVTALGISRGLELHRNVTNLGFCGAHNQGAARCVAGGFDAMLILNPDVGLSANCLQQMVESLSSETRTGIITPKLLRAADDLSPLSQSTIDAAGMILTHSLRHFDRGSGEVDRGEYEVSQEVFGATGACLLISSDCIEAVALPALVSDEVVWKIYPQLREGSPSRVKLFDEAFFAYREDADLSWRAGRMGWRCIYTPAAVANHVRVVTPERRSKLPDMLNRLSVRNRFLLQCNNWDLSCGFASLLWGIIVRNLLVILGVLVKERSSLPGIMEAIRLVPRARTIYRATRSSSPSGGFCAQAEER